MFMCNNVANGVNSDSKLSVLIGYVRPIKWFPKPQKRIHDGVVYGILMFRDDRMYQIMYQIIGLPSYNDVSS